MRMTLHQICTALCMPLPATDCVVNGASMDSRSVQAGDLFVCIRGERVDGHDYAEKAVNAGASVVLAEHPLPAVAAMGVPVLCVANSVVALGQIAHAWRMSFAGTVVVVTGSAGKTTVKEVLTHVLAQKAPTACNYMNLNNQIGMPLSVLKTTGAESFWVMEAGISQPHDMDELGHILAPDIALILNVGGAHNEGLGEKGVAWHKAQLLKYVRNGGTAFVGGDYPELVSVAATIMHDVHTFSGTAEKGLLYAHYKGLDAENKGCYEIHVGQKVLTVHAPFYGVYGAENAVAITAVAVKLGLTDVQIQQGFATATLPQQRFSVQQCGAWTVIDDTYNANPLSMRRMLDAAVDMAKGSKVVAVLGAMGELGTTVQAEHTVLGMYLGQHKIYAVIWKGPFADAVRQGLQLSGWSCPFHIISDTADFTKKWCQYRGLGGVVLCKGSRANALEEYVPIVCAGGEENNVL